MSSTAAAFSNDGNGNVLRPRPVKPANPLLLRTQSDNEFLKPNGITDIPSGVSRLVYTFLKTSADLWICDGLGPVMNIENFGLFSEIFILSTTVVGRHLYFPTPLLLPSQFIL